MIHLQSYIEDKSNKAEDRAKGKGILKKVMEYKLIWFLHFMRDVLNEIAKLSLLLQREDVTLPSIMIKVQSVQVALSEMMDIIQVVIFKGFKRNSMVLFTRNTP